MEYWGLELPHTTKFTWENGYFCHFSVLFSQEIIFYVPQLHEMTDKHHLHVTEMNTYIKSIGFVLQVVYKMPEWDRQSSRVVHFSWFLGPHLYACLPLSDIYTYKTIEFTK